MSWDDLNPNHYVWPTINELRAYRNKVRKIVDDVIMNSKLELPINWSSPFWIVLMGIEHERIHLETSSVLFRQLNISDVQKQDNFPLCPFYDTKNKSTTPTAVTDAPMNELLPVTGGKVSLGKSHDHHLYGWDNEYGTHIYDVPSFKASKYLVSNAEYLEFMKDDGYKTERYWTKEGWGFATFKNTGHPVFWVPIKDKDGNITDYLYRSMSEEIPMPWNWPVDVNNLEAKAFCNWKNEKRQLQGDLPKGYGIRLPLEEEWFRLREYSTPGNVHADDQPFWNDDDAPGNISLFHWASSCPVDMFEHRGSNFYDVIGNVWQHCETPMAPFSGFKVHPAYDDFTVPTFDNMHNIIKGGSFISVGNEATIFARYAFRRHFYQHAGIRYIEGDMSIVPETENRDHLEIDPVVANAMEDHYGDYKGPLSIVSNLLPKYCNDITTTTFDAVKKYTNNTQDNLSSMRVMEIGCSVGRTSFELAKYFGNVVGYDHSTRFIQIGTLLKQFGLVKYSIVEEGDLHSFHCVDLHDFGYHDISSKVEFLQGDASNIDLTKHNNYDVVVFSSGFTRLYSPRKFLQIVHQLVEKDGLFILSTNNDWTESQTNCRSEWIGGHKDDMTGEIVDCNDTISQYLSKYFTLCTEPKDMINLQRKLGRSATVTVSNVTIWKRK